MLLSEVVKLSDQMSWNHPSLDEETKIHQIVSSLLHAKASLENWNSQALPHYYQQRFLWYQLHGQVLIVYDLEINCTCQTEWSLPFKQQSTACDFHEEINHQTIRGSEWEKLNHVAAKFQRAPVINDNGRRVRVGIYLIDVGIIGTPSRMLP
jgi:hypothetical protein